ncbi:MAG: recombinase family protein, partial [SAR324 cluster bacterium]|nr:recombinase family protein [SAR324 cluster bacterium]
LKRMLAWQSEGFGSYKIARLLNEETGDHPRTGRPWDYGTVAAILRGVKRGVV